MNGKIVVVAGGSGGIGSALARRLHASGARLALFGRDEARLSAVASDTGALALTVDALDAGAVAAAFERVEAELGEIDGYAHAVGSVLLKPLHATSPEEWRATYELNATSAFSALRALGPKMMRRKRGSIVLFSTVAATTGLTNHAAIASAKSAVEGLTRSAALDYARYGVRVNALAPALTRTALSRALWENETSLAASVAMHPLGRIGEPGDVAAAAAYLLSDDASWVTGQVLAVDGGLSVGMLPPRVAAKT